jgi:hypothetical protein
MANMMSSLSVDSVDSESGGFCEVASEVFGSATCVERRHGRLSALD